MRSWRLTLILSSAFATLLCVVAVASTAAARSARPRTVLFDAEFTAQRTAGPDADDIGHRQIASGVLHDSNGRAVGRFGFGCEWTRIFAGGDALERCSGFGRTADGRLDVVGPARESEAVHDWKLTGESGAYRSAHGKAVVRDIGDRESLITATVARRAGRSCASRSSPVRPPTQASSLTPISSAPPRRGSWRRCHRFRLATSIGCIPTPRCCPRSAR